MAAQHTTTPRHRCGQQWTCGQPRNTVAVLARTPLLTMFEGLAAEHAANGPPWSTPLSRRRLLTAAAAAGVAGTLASAGVRPARLRAAGPRIAIVGGGIAGLTAALTLADKGTTSTIYEASDRVGGRMHSDTRGYWADGQTSEWCGELIDTDHKTILALAQRYRLATVDAVGAEPNGSEDTLYFFESYYPKTQADVDFKPVHKALQRDVQGASYPTLFDSFTKAGQALDQMSVYDWIESRVPGGHTSPLGLLLDVAYNIEYGAETTDQSALNIVYLLGYNAKPGNFSIFGKSNERYRIAGGNERLPSAIRDDLVDRGLSVHTSTRMNSISRQVGGTYAISFDGLSTPVLADHVILALPFAVLRTLDYSNADFDPLKDVAIQQLGRSQNAKLQLQFARRLWNDSGAWPGIGNGASYADTGYQNTWDVSRGQPGTRGILVDYTGGDVAASFAPSVPYSDASSNAQVVTYSNTFLEELEFVYPGVTSQWTGRATLSVPALDPNLKLAYSYYRVGQYTTFGGHEKARQGNVHFAGEHCSQDFQGFMEGGASEGVRAAKEVLADLK
jgi:monoamine oxidase